MKKTTDIKCYACNKPITSKPHLADTHEDQLVVVGPICYKRIVVAGEDGYQPPLGGPRLYVLRPREEIAHLLEIYE